jgi:glycosyltransferase involved in cell wall biosynthesis
MSVTKHRSLFQRPRKVRLLELRNTYKWGGGPDKTILLSAERHDPSRVEVTVAYIRDEHDHEFSIGVKASAKGLTFYEIKERGKLDLQVLHTLCDIVERHDINLVHSHDYKSDLFAELLRWKLRGRRPAVISTLHGWALLGGRGYLYWLLDLFLMRRFDHLIAVSNATKVEMVAAGVPADLVTVIHNAIDTETWSQSQVRSSAREALGLSNTFPVVGYVGRISPEKDLVSWLRVAALVVEQYPAARFVCIGEGKNDELLKRLKDLAADLCIADKVYFLGYREDLASIYAIFDLFLLSSRREGICNSLLEAMAMGIPIVATDAGGTKELMVDGETGYLLPVGDVKGMADAVNKLIRDETLRKNIGRAARRRIEDEFSFTFRMRRMEALYERVLDEVSDRPACRSLPLRTR